MFDIKIIDAKELGVFSGEVTPPAAFVCKKSDRVYARFFYILEGKIIFNKNTDKMISASKGMIVYLPNDITYQSEWGTEENGKYISIHFILEEFYLRLPEELCIAAIDSSGVYLELFTHAYRIWSAGAIGYKLEVLSTLYKIFYQLFTDTTYKKIKSRYSMIHRGIIYLENHYMEEVSVEALVKMCSVSESCFRRHFKEYKGMSPITYKNYLRIKKAKELIESGECNVTEAAAAVSIPDLCYFHKLFKRFFGKAPGTLKRS